MAYVKQPWVAHVTPLDVAHMTHIEDGIAAVDAKIPATVNGQWIKGVGGALVWSAITVADVAGAQATSQKGAANGYASLDGTTKVPVAQLPNGDLQLSGYPTGAGSTDAGSNASFVHAGYGNLAAFTPRRTGRMLCGWNANIFAASGTPTGVDAYLAYGTGAKPAANAAATGTTLGTWQPILLSSASDNRHLVFAWPVAGLTIGTAYWLDLVWRVRAGGGNVGMGSFWGWAVEL